ncbi:hypothetical protein [Paenibacillus sp. FSL L8-0333]|uniref:hypothetical protein n=1 Tax=Paenibacillus sp. FSL L8-0333 TaxID=2975331 RepID=UPI0030CB84DB
MKTLHFTYDPLALIRIVLQRFVEETIQGKFYKAKQFACYEYLTKLSDEGLENLLHEYTKRHELEAITLADWRKDGKLIFDIIFELPEYQQLEIDFKKRGYGSTGLGVLDVGRNTFYDCAFVQHWPTIQRIIETEYPRYHEPLQKMYIFESLMEHDGVTREELENFITNNFELFGGTKPLQEYL